LPGKLAVELVDIPSAAEAADIVRAEVYAAMESIAGYRYDQARFEERVHERMRLSGGEWGEEADKNE
jgi:hypothetical protein